MARTPRIDVPGVPQHVVQRGVNRSVCFADNRDYEFYLASAGAISRLMQSLGRTYVRRFNDRYCRSGTLWEGRFKSCLVDREQYVLTCYRYIELNPVRAKMVEQPAHYRWSSVHHNLIGREDSLIKPHEAYLRLSPEPIHRLTSYGALLNEALTEDELTGIRAHIKQGKAYGSASFQAQIQQLTGRCVELRGRGRPKTTHQSE